MRIRYSRWDGTQRIDDLDADDLLAAMADDLTADGDLWKALRRLFQRGVHNPHGPQMPGLRDLNRMLREKAEGGEPDFQSFKDKWGQTFPGVESFDQLMEQIGRQMAQMQSLLQSMSPEQRQQLEEMMRSLFLK